MSVKISVKEYLEDSELLEINYIPYDHKVEICSVILDQCISEFEDYHTLNSVLLNRVKTEIFLGYITNIDLSIKDENGLNGYDQLCLNDELDSLIDACGHLYDQFEDVLELMMRDYYHNIASTRGYMNILKTKTLDWLSVLKRDASDAAKKFDSKKILEMLNKAKNI